MDAANSPHRVPPRRIHHHPRHPTDLAAVQRTSGSGIGNTSGPRRILRLTYRRVGRVPAGHHPNLIDGRARRESGVREQCQYYPADNGRPGTTRAEHTARAKNVSDSHEARQAL